MGSFLKRHKAVHIWAVLVAALFGIYAYGISSREAANAVSSVTQTLKDGYARLWYLFPFSVVEWFYVAFILGVIIWIVVLVIRTVKGPDRGHRFYGGIVGLACLCLTAWGLYCVLWGVNYYADGFQEKSGIYAQPVEVDELERVLKDMHKSNQSSGGQLGLTELDDIFHDRLLMHCHNPYLVDLARHSCSTISKYLMYRQWTAFYSFNELYERHVMLVEAMRSRDRMAVWKKIREHYEELGAYMAELMEKSDWTQE